MLLFIAVAGELGFSSFDSVTNAIAFNERSREMMSNHSINLATLNYTLLNETIVKDFATSIFVFDLISLLQKLLQTYCFLILTNDTSKLTMGLWQRRISIFLLTYMIVCNLAIWGSCSFLEMEYKKGNVSLYIINKIVLGETNWRFVTTFLFPLVLYFRFHLAKLILISITHVHSAENP